MIVYPYMVREDAPSWLKQHMQRRVHRRWHGRQRRDRHPGDPRPAQPGQGRGGRLRRTRSHAAALRRPRRPGVVRRRAAGRRRRLARDRDDLGGGRAGLVRPAARAARPQGVRVAPRAARGDARAPREGHPRSGPRTPTCRSRAGAPWRTAMTELSIRDGSVNLSLRLARPRARRQGAGQAAIGPALLAGLPARPRAGPDRARRRPARWCVRCSRWRPCSACRPSCSSARRLRHRQRRGPRALRLRRQPARAVSWSRWR